MVNSCYTNGGRDFTTLKPSTRLQCHCCLHHHILASCGEGNIIWYSLSWRCFHSVYWGWWWCQHGWWCWALGLDQDNDKDIVLNDLATSDYLVLDDGIPQVNSQKPLPILNYSGLLARHTELCWAISNNQKYLASALSTIYMMIKYVWQKRSIDVTFDINPLEFLIPKKGKQTTAACHCQVNCWTGK
jgi:hypothetical protein